MNALERHKSGGWLLTSDTVAELMGVVDMAVQNGWHTAGQVELTDCGRVFVLLEEG